MAKKQAKAKQHPDAELLLFENYLLSLSTLSSKNNRRYSKKCAKNKCVYLNNHIFKYVYLNYIINDNETDAENEK